MVPPPLAILPWQAARADPSAHAATPPQLLLDVVCSTGAFTIGSGLGQAGLPAWGIALQILAYFAGEKPPKCLGFTAHGLGVKL
jgi:hypothetical protein